MNFSKEAERKVDQFKMMECRVKSRPVIPKGFVFTKQWHVNENQRDWLMMVQTDKVTSFGSSSSGLFKSCFLFNFTWNLTDVF